MAHPAVILPLDPTSAGTDALTPYRPTMLSLAQTVCYAAENKLSLVEAAPIHLGMNLLGITSFATYFLEE